MKYQLSFNKSLVALLMGIFSCVNLQAQLQEMEATKTSWTTLGEIKWLANTKASLKYFVSSNDTTYLLYLQDEEKLKNSRDMTVRKYFSIRFSGIDNTTGKLYDLLTSFFSGENRNDKKLEKIFKLGNEMVHIQHYPKMMGAAIMLSTKENHIVFSEKELKKLFGR
ncbi:MAG: hypothetical protein ABIP79_05610 [Chitinophagaceae bacterium]